MTTTVQAIPARHLDVILWVLDGRVRSTTANDTAQIRCRRPGTASHAITANAQSAAAAGLVERVPGSAEWRVTDAGRAALDAEVAFLIVDETAMADKHGRRGVDWWTDHYRSAADLTHDADGTVRIHCVSQAHAQRWADLMVANGVPKTALRIEAP
jgi:hypothetical protein